MKKKILGALALLFVLSPMVVSAKTYNVDDNMSVDLDNKLWYVFTRDNIKDNPDLDELGITYEYMNDTFNKNQMYLDATIFYENGNDFMELLVRKSENDKVMNLTNYSNDDVLELAKELAKKTGSTDYDVYENDYKFVRSKYVDKNIGYYIIEYSTIVNGINYTMTMQKTTEFDESEEYFVETIVNSTKFNVDETLKEPKSSIDWNQVISKGIVGAVTGAIIGLVYGIFTKKKNKKVSNI